MLLDSNIIIFSVQPNYLRLLEYLSKSKGISVSVISKVEVLGYHKLSEFDKESFQLFFDSIPMISLSNEIVEVAIKLKQHRKMSLGDSMIAATAIVKKQALLTNNVEDFQFIEGLEVIAMNDVV
jgi:predicted nucleic acid-binding protein